MQTLEVDGTEVLIEGQGGHTIVMIHGWPDTHALWDAQVPVLAPHLRCVRFTLPGFDLQRGRRGLDLEAMTAQLAAIVDAVSPGQPVTLLLHDWGAVYGYQYAMRHAERVARLVGVDVGEVSSSEFVRSLSWKAKLGIAAYQGWLALAYLMPAALGDRMTRWMARQLRAPAPAAHIAAQMNHPYVSNWTGGFMRSLAVRPRCPMLFVFGQRKPFMFHASAWAERIAATPGGAVRGLPTGHWVMVQQPEAFNRILLDWLGLGSRSS